MQAGLGFFFLLVCLFVFCCCLRMHRKSNSRKNSPQGWSHYVIESALIPLSLDVAGKT